MNQGIGRLKGELPVTCRIGPGSCRPALLHRDDAIVKCYCRTDVIRDAIKNFANPGDIAGNDVDYQVFFTLTDGFHLRAIQKAYPPGDLVLRGDAFMPKVETKTGVGANRDHAGNDEGGRLKRLIRELRVISFIPVDESAGAALYICGTAGV